MYRSYSLYDISEIQIQSQNLINEIIACDYTYFEYLGS